MNAAVEPVRASVPVRDGPRLPVWLLVATAVGCGLFFVGIDTDTYWPTWARRLWNSGHFLVFAGLGWIGWRWLPGCRAATRWAAGLAIALVAGVAIELLQLRSGGREVALDDIALDLAGAWVGLWWASQYRLWRRHRGLAVGVAAIAVLASAWAAAPVVAAGSSALAARWAFPVLFEPGLLAVRQRMDPSGQAALALEPDALSVRLGSGQFAGFKLFDVPSDWRNFQALAITLDNTAGRTLSITCRVHDIPHNQMYSDRYNRSFALSPGVSTLTIDLNEVASAPAGRRMAMAAILEVGCFAAEPAAGEVLLLREMRLQ